MPSISLSHFLESPYILWPGVADVQQHVISVKCPPHRKPLNLQHHHLSVGKPSFFRFDQTTWRRFCRWTATCSCSDSWHLPKSYPKKSSTSTCFFAPSALGGTKVLIWLCTPTISVLARLKIIALNPIHTLTVQQHSQTFRIAIDIKKQGTFWWNRSDIVQIQCSDSWSL